MEQQKDRLIETLSRGKDFAQRLQNVLLGQTNVNGTIFVKDLVTQILDSFSAGLSLLNSSDSTEIYGVRAGSHLVLASPVDRNMSQACPGKKPATGHVKQRRGCYKRRRTIDSSVKICSTIEDGYAWRKYGQKEILNSKFPRCYFRCTHKHFHGCKAVKQVQKLENESNMFHITYFGQHTCPKPNTLSHHKVADIDFEDINNHNHFSNSPSTITNYNIHNIDPFVKQEVDSKAQSTDVSDIISTGNDDQSSPSLMWDEVLRDDHLGSCDHEDVASFMRFDQQLEDSCASTSSHDYMNMEFLNAELLGDILLDGRVFPRLS